MRFLAVSLLLAQIASPPPPPSRLVEDVRRLEADSNEARFDALTGMPRERGIPFSVSLAILPAVEAHQVWLLTNTPPNPDGPQPAVPPIMRIIHTAADSSEKLDPASMARLLDLTLGIVRALAGPARVIREG